MNVASFVFRQVLGTRFARVIRFLHSNVPQRQKQCSEDDNHRYDQSGNREHRHLHILHRETVRFGFIDLNPQTFGIVGKRKLPEANLAGICNSVATRRSAQSSENVVEIIAQGEVPRSHARRSYS